MLRVPDFLIGKSVIKDNKLRETIPIPSIGITYLYPAMTLSGWKSQMEVMTENENGTYVPTPDRFSVNIVWLFYSPGEIGNLPRLQLQDPRPPRIMHNLHDCLPLAKCIEMIYRPTQLPDMESIVSSEWLLSHPEDKVHDPRKGATYIAKKNVPYEAFIDCAAPDEGQCLAFVFIKKNNFQYRMQFPSEAINHADQVIRKFNNLVDNWAASANFSN